MSPPPPPPPNNDQGMGFDDTSNPRSGPHINTSPLTKHIKLNNIFSGPKSQSPKLIIIIIIIIIVNID